VEKRYRFNRPLLAVFFVVVAALVGAGNAFGQDPSPDNWHSPHRDITQISGHVGIYNYTGYDSLRVYSPATGFTHFAHQGSHYLRASEAGGTYFQAPNGRPVVHIRTSGSLDIFNPQSGDTYFGHDNRNNYISSAADGYTFFRSYNGSSYATTAQISGAGDMDVSGSLNVDNQLIAHRDSYVEVKTQDPTYGLIIRDQDSDSLGNIDANDGYLVIGYNNADGPLTVTSDRVGIGTHTPEEELHVVGDGYFEGSITTTGTITTGSSRDLKQDIEPLPLDEAIAALMELNAVKYAYAAAPGEQVLGFIAEDVPDLVATNDRRSLNPWDIITVLVPVVQEQQRVLSGQSAEIESLKTQVGVE
jgi:hypothetical protein